jgi:hypothetical protein
MTSLMAALTWARGLEEVVGVLDRGRFRHHDQDALPRCEEEVEDVEACPGAEIQDHVIDLESVDVAEDFALLAIVGIGHLDQGFGAGHQPDVVDWRCCHHLAKGTHSLRDEVGQICLGARHAEQGVEVGAAEIGIDECDALVQIRDRSGDVGRDDRLPDSAFATTDGPDARPCHATIRRSFGHLGIPAPIPGADRRILGVKPGTGVTLIISDSLAPRKSYAFEAESGG